MNNPGYSGLLLVRGENDQPTDDIYFAAIRKLVSTRARNVLTAGDAGQQVLDGGLESRGVFTGSFPEGLRGAADADGDSCITVYAPKR